MLEKFRSTEKTKMAKPSYIPQSANQRGVDDVVLSGPCFMLNTLLLNPTRLPVQASQCREKSRNSANPTLNSLFGAPRSWMIHEVLIQIQRRKQRWPVRYEDFDHIFATNLTLRDFHLQSNRSLS